MLSSGDGVDTFETLIASQEERNLGSVGWSSPGDTNNVVILAKEPVNPSILLGTAGVLEEVNRAVEPGITDYASLNTILSTRIANLRETT